MTPVRHSAFFVAAVLIAGAVWAGESLTEEQLAAKFYFDLGPKQIDVSAYPKAQQEGYRLFTMVCAQCHTTARALSAPITDAKDWKRYVTRMHIRSRAKLGTVMTREWDKQVAEFLAYDSQVRKVKGKEAFDRQSEELKAFFAQVQKEKLRRQAEADKNKARQAPLYTGEKPQP